LFSFAGTRPMPRRCLTEPSEWHENQAV